MNPFRKLAGEADDAVDFYRASGNCICEQCGEFYICHEMDREHLGFQGEPFLHILCNGDRVKL